VGYPGIEPGWTLSSREIYSLARIHIGLIPQRSRSIARVRCGIELVFRRHLSYPCYDLSIFQKAFGRSRFPWSGQSVSFWTLNALAALCILRRFGDVKITREDHVLWRGIKTIIDMRAGRF
jgi:hypothetical protein